jgi:hypothetical protein
MSNFILALNHAQLHNTSLDDVCFFFGSRGEKNCVKFLCMMFPPVEPDLKKTIVGTLTHIQISSILASL